MYGEYHNYKFGTDFRSLRYPSVISTKFSKNSAMYSASDVYHKAIKERKYTECLKPGLMISALYIDDLISGTIKFIETPSDQLKQRVYNIQSTSFTIQEQADSIKEVIPDFAVQYEINENQALMDMLPEQLDDSAARKDWGYESNFNLNDITRDMIYDIK